MKRLGIILIAIGIALLMFVFYNFIKEKNKLASPIPEDTGVKVIFVTPSK
jgi:glycopeptide antibiotics resistance protein